MSNELVISIDENERVGTWILSQGFEVEHRAVKRLIKKYFSEFEEFGKVIEGEAIHCNGVVTNKVKKKKGGQIEEYKLNELQSTYLATLLTNNDVVRYFKRKLTRTFFAQRQRISQLLVQRQNAEWIEKRANGKIERRLETDTIKAFVEYAQVQGSQNASKYYMIISKMENQTLFALDFVGQKFANLREVLNGFALDQLKMADHIVGKALKDGMKDLLPYKDIYQLAKFRVEQFASIMGKTPIQTLIESTSSTSP